MLKIITFDPHGKHTHIHPQKEEMLKEMLKNTGYEELDVVIKNSLTSYIIPF